MMVKASGQRHVSACDFEQDVIRKDYDVPIRMSNANVQR